MALNAGRCAVDAQDRFCDPLEDVMAKKTAASRSKVKDLKVQKKSAVKVKAGLKLTNKRDG